MRAVLIPKRYLLVVLTFLLSLLLYIDRVNISAAKESIADSLSLTDKQFGWSSRPSLWATPCSRRPGDSWPIATARG